MGKIYNIKRKNNEFAVNGIRIELLLYRMFRLRDVI